MLSLAVLGDGPGQKKYRRKDGEKDGEDKGNRDSEKQRNYQYIIENKDASSVGLLYLC
jgi:hypothetical protein